ncbi:PREDICTED: RNA-binding protein 42-like [Tarenaya hassleriana]|uniref:RNA-binding protein 42-like n=1 Tax=Tarenaya hassleriana TaxID=28532 RepID=UPI00053C54CA|nr:PREDICTED: RNA-binding protein 42-like [Tarenaya hassleriana]
MSIAPPPAPIPMAAAVSSSSQFPYADASYFPVAYQSSLPYVAHAAPSSVSVVAPVYSAPVSSIAPIAGAYPLPQYQQAQQLFQRDAQIITPEALQTVKAALASSEAEGKAEAKKKAIPRKAAGQHWEDQTLADWPENDYRLFCGDLGNEVNDDVLSKAFSRYLSFNMARVIRDKRTSKTRGYGFVSFANPADLAAALKEMNGKYVGNRPIKLRKSTWKQRIDYEVLEKLKNQSQKKPKPPKKSVLHK